MKKEEEDRIFLLGMLVGSVIGSIVGTVLGSSVVAYLTK